GVEVEPAALGKPIALVVAAGLLLGKLVGVVLASWLSVRLGLTRLPEGIDWKVMVGAGLLAGIGFTMALFIAGLALEGVLLEEAKIGILFGSTLAAVLGFLMLKKVLPAPPTGP